MLSGQSSRERCCGASVAQVKIEEMDVAIITQVLHGVARMGDVETGPDPGCHISWQSSTEQ